MELFLGFRKTFLSVWFLLFIGNVKAQVLVDDLMMDTPVGKLPNPLLTMATIGTAPARQANAVQPTVGDLMVDTVVGELPNPMLTMAAQGTAPTRQANAVQPTGGGFNVHRFPVLGTDANTMFPIDASRIAGVANGQTIYLPGILSNHFHSGSPVVLPAQTISTSATDPNQQYVLKNEEFTALGNIGHHVRVPIPNISSADKSASSSGSRTSQPDGTITVDPKDIIGVADMNQVGADGNPAFYSFNPGSGHASELSALQSALQGKAVDMSGLLPPPFDAQSSNEFPTSSTSTSTFSTSSTNESTSLDLVIDTAPSSQTNANSVFNTLGMNSVSALNNPSRQDKSMVNINQGSTFADSNAQQGTLPLNEISTYDAVTNTGESMTNTQDQITFNSGSVAGSTDINMDSTLNTNEQRISATGVISAGSNLNEHSMANTNEQSMFGTGSVSSGIHLNEQSKTNTNEQTIFSTGRVSGGMNSNDQSMRNTNERSRFGMGSATSEIPNLNYQTRNRQTENNNVNTKKQSKLGIGSVSSGMNSNDQLMTNTNERSMFGTGGASGVATLNEQSRTNTNDQTTFGTGTISGSTNLNDQYILNTNEQALFGTGSGVSDGTSLNTQSVGNTNEQPVLHTGSVTGVRPNLNYQTMDRQIERNNVHTNKQSKVGMGNASSVKNSNEQLMTNTNERSMFGTGSASGGTTLNEQSGTNINEQTRFGTRAISGSTNLDDQFRLNTHEQSMLGTGRASGGTTLNEQSRSNTNEQSMFSTGTVSGSTNLNDQYRLNTNEQALFDSRSVSDGTSLDKQSRTNTKEQSVLDAGGVNGERSIMNYQTRNRQTETSNVNTNELRSNTHRDLFSQPPYNTDVNTRIGIFGQTDAFTTGQGSKQSLSKNQSIKSVNEPSSINTGVSKTNYIPNERTGTNTGRKANNIVGTNEQLKINTEMQQTDIITNDQLRLNQKNQVINGPSVVNVDTNTGVRTDLSNTGVTSIGGLFGVVDRENKGSSSSRFSGLNNNNIKMGMETGGGEQAYTVAGNTATGTVDGTTDISSVATQVDSLLQTNRGTARLLGVSDIKADNLLSNNEKLSLSLTNSVTPTPDSSNTVSSQRANSLRDIASQNVPHVSDLNTEGIYPFEGSLSAMDATLTDGSSAVLDMNSVLQGKEPLHLEPPQNILGEVVSGASVSETSGSNTGIYAVTGDTNTAYINQQGTTHIDTSTGRSVKSARDVSSSTNALTSTNRNTNEALGVSFVSGGNKANGLAIDKVHQYVGAENVNNKQTSSAGNGIEINLVDVNKMTKENRLISTNENASQMTNSQNRLTEANHRITDASKLSNDHREGLTVAGNINNDINAINTLEASSNMVNNKDTAITDGVGVAMSGFSGAPITNMVGVKPGISRGGLTVKGINIPSYQSTSRKEEFSSNSSQEVLGSLSSNNDIPMGSFVIGAGQPNSKVINTGIVDSLPASNVGGVALGSGMPDLNSNIPGISLPQSAFKNDNRLNIEQKQAITERPKSVKVDMSSFIPPPYEEPRRSSSLNVLDQNTLRGGSIADVARNAAFLDRQNEIDRFRKIVLSNEGSAVTKQFNEHISDRTASSGGLSGRHGMGSTLREGATAEIASNAALLDRQKAWDHLRNQVLPNQGSADMQQFNEHINDRTASSRRLSSRHGTRSTLREGATAEIATNTALPDRQNKIDRSRNQVVSNQGSAIAQQFNEHLNNRIDSKRGLTSRRGMGSTDISSTNTRTSASESSNIVTSSEHFGKPVRSDIASEMSSGWQRSRKASVTSVGEQSQVPSIVADHAIFTDLAKDTNPRHRNNEVAVALDINRNTNRALENLSAEQFASQPIVGSIFGTVENASSNTLTKKFLEKSGITREPAVDFMTTFLQRSKPAGTLNRGNESLQIVPLGSDIPNLSPNTDKIIITGSQSDAQTVDQFGVADIYTRRQQLNPSQWQQLMAKVSHEPSSRLHGINVDYQTQNVIGAGETRPLTSNINQGSSMSETLSQFSSSTQARDIDRSNTNRKIPISRQSNVRSAILFEAPGMTGHKSVTIRNYVPSTLKRPSSRSTVQSRVKSSNDVSQQSLQEFVGTQATAERTSSFANTFRQNQEAGAVGVPVFNRNAGVSINSVSLPLKDRLSADPQLQPEGKLGEAGQKIQNEMNTFKLGKSILISDGVIPKFTGPNSVHRLPIDASHLRSLTANGIRLGQPSIMSQGGSKMDNSQQSGLESFSSQTVNSQSPSVGSLISPLTVNSRQSNLGSLDSEMTNILQSRIGSLDSHVVKNSRSTKSLDSQLVNNLKNNMGSDSQIITNRQSGIGSRDSQMRSNRQSTLGSRDSQIINELQSAMGSIDSQMTNSRQTRLGSLDSQMLNNRQSTPVQTHSESHKTSSGEITLQDIHGSAFAVGLGSDSHGNSLSNRLGIAIGGGLSSDLSGGLSQSQQNFGIAVNGDLNSAMNMKSNAAQVSGPNTGSNQAIQNIGLTGANQVSTGMTAANIEQRNLDTSTILGLNQALKKQPMEATLFTSGSRFAVFGRADDVAGRSLGSSMQAKPIPARRMGVLGPIHDCRHKPDPSSEYYFIYKYGIEQYRFRCALGTAFDEMTCECSIRVSDHGDCLEVHMDFNNGIVEDSSLNRLPIGNENVEITNSSSPLAGIALFGGDSKLTIWRYQNYDFRDHIMLKVQFRPGVGGDRYQPLISNCDGGGTGPSVAILYESSMHEVILVLQTVNDTMKELKFKVNPHEWNDVTYIYDGQEFIGIVNGVRRYVSRENPHLLGIIGGEIKATHAEGLIEIRDAALVVGHCPMYGHFRGAMVDIQVYTCIPKLFRLE